MKKVTVDLQLVQKNDHYDEEIVINLTNLTSSIECFRRIYLGTTVKAPSKEMPILIIETLTDKDDEKDGEDVKFADIEVETIQYVMGYVFKGDYQIKKIPNGPWWGKIEAITQKVRGIQ